MPVKSIEIPNLSAASIDSWSLIEPPGCMIAVIPALWAASTQSGKGKKASDAITLPAARSPACRIAFSSAHILLTCPGPTPVVQKSFARTIPFDFVCLT